MSENPDLSELREEIEQVDRELMGQLRRRMTLSEQVAQAKLDKALPFRDAAREDQVLGRIRRLAVELELDPRGTEQLYRLLMAMSVSRQQAYLEQLEQLPLRVAYHGSEGSYSHLAAQRTYARRPGGVLLTGHETLRDAADTVRSGEADLALLPIESSAAGSLNETYDLLVEEGLHITHEVVTELEHQLLGLPGATLEGLTTVLSHPQALSQCEPELRAFPWIRTQAVADTALAARKVRQKGEVGIGAIASEAAAIAHGLVVLRTLGSEGHRTRFVEVARAAGPIPEAARCKTSLIVVLDHRPGALNEVLAAFTRRRINLTKLESRGLPGANLGYRFFVDVEGHAQAPELHAALEEIRTLAREVRSLGTYPEAGQHPRWA